MEFAPTASLERRLNGSNDTIEEARPTVIHKKCS